MLAVLLLLLFAQAPRVLVTENGTITGVLRTAEGTPATGVRVTAQVPPEAPNSTKVIAAGITQTDENGRYRLEGIVPGRYFISAGNLARPTYYPGTSDIGAGRIVTVGARQAVFGIDFALLDKSSGRATPDRSQPNRLVIALDISTDGGGKVPVFQGGVYPTLKLRAVNSAAEYEYTLNTSQMYLALPPASGEEYKVTIGGLSDGYSVKSITHDGAEALTANLKALPTPSRRIQVGNLSTLAGSSTLAVVLTRNPVSTPRRGAVVRGTSIRNDAEVFIGDIAGYLYTDGTFEFRDVPPGTHTIAQFAPNSLLAAGVVVGERDVDNVKVQRPTLLPVDFPASLNLQNAGANMESRVLSLLSLKATLLDEVSRAPITEGAVTVGGYRGTRAVIAVSGDGSFQLSGLLPGSYTLTVSVSGYRNASQSITLGDEDLKLEILAGKE